MPEEQNDSTDIVFGALHRDIATSDEQKRLDAEKDFMIAISRRLPDLIASVVREVRSQHPTITEELVIVDLVQKAITTASNSAQEITMNSRPS